MLNQDVIMTILSYLDPRVLIGLSLNKRYNELLPNLLRSTIVTRLDLSEFSLAQLVTLTKDYQIVTGEHHATVKIDNKVYAFGYTDDHNYRIIDSDNPILLYDDAKQVACYDYDIPYINLQNRLISYYVKCDNVIKISANGSYFAFLTIDNTLYVCGNLGETIFEELVLINAHVQDKIVDIAAGDCFLLVLTEKGRVYSMGNNKYGGLGLGDLINRNKLTLIPNLKDIVQITAQSASLCLDKFGRVYVFGRSGLGLGDKIDRLLPTLIPELKDIAEIKNGHWFALALDKFGNVWSFGDNWNGQLGYPGKEDQLKPKKVDVNNIITVAAGLSCSYLVNRDGQVLACGLNMSGQLGFERCHKVENFVNL